MISSVSRRLRLASSYSYAWLLLLIILLGFFLFFFFRILRLLVLSPATSAFSSSSSSFQHQLLFSSASNAISWPTSSFFSYASASNVTFFSICCAFLRWHLLRFAPAASPPHIPPSIPCIATGLHTTGPHTNTHTRSYISHNTSHMYTTPFSAPSPLWLIREPLTWIWIYHKTNRFAIQLRPAFQWTSAAASFSTRSSSFLPCTFFSFAAYKSHHIYIQRKSASPYNLLHHDNRGIHFHLEWCINGIVFDVQWLEAAPL